MKKVPKVDWKPKKSKEPFVGSYNDHNGKDYTLRRSYSCKFDKSKAPNFSNKSA